MTTALKSTVAKVLSAAAQSSGDSLTEIEAAVQRLRDLMEQATGRKYRCHVDVPLGFAMVAERLEQDGGRP